MTSPTATLQADVAIVGGGIVGMATAWQLTQRYPGKRLVIIEKESRLGAHQTSHNSGVLHSGIYYRPGSLRALNCRAGKEAMQAFCREHGLPHDICGKVIVAVGDDELPRLDKIYERGQANGVRCEIIDRDRLCELEPHTAGIRAIHVPEAGIADFHAVCLRMGRLVQDAGGQILLNTRLIKAEARSDAVIVHTSSAEIRAGWLITCAGLHADRVTQLTGQSPAARIVPFRGEYYELKPAARHLCRNLIYPVPDPRFPFLGVHFTRMIQGGVECGPNAVLAMKREGYSKLDFSPRDLFGSLTYGGFVRMASKYWRTGAGEMWRSVSKRAFVTALQRLVPEIRSEHLEPAPAGVRAQALGPDGEFVDDFVFQESDRIINVGNAPSPAATASINIGKIIVDKLAARWT